MWIGFVTNSPTPLPPRVAMCPRVCRQMANIKYRYTPRKNSSSTFWDPVEPLYLGHFGTLILVLITEVTSIQRSLNTLQYNTWTQNCVLNIEVCYEEAQPYYKTNTGPYVRHMHRLLHTHTQ